MERLGILWNIVASLTILFVLSACSLTADVLDISEVDLAFETPAEDTYSNKTNFDFKLKFSSDNKNLTLEKAKLYVFEDENCDSEKLLETRDLKTETVSATANSLENGKKYSARVMMYHDGRTFQSVCSPWLGIDTELPESVAVNYPSNNGYITSKQILAAWSKSVDHGISGLKEEPYRLRLYGLAACAGDALQTVDSQEENYLFKNLTHGVVYSVLVSAVDRAGNESVVSCSPYTEIDVYAPGFSLTDSSSIPGYSRVLNSQITFNNDSSTAYWCLTSDTNFRPTQVTDACPSGTGPSSGWYTTRPTTLPLPAGDGLKSYNLWAFRADGTLVSSNVTSNAIILDRTLPGAFTVSGVGSENEDLHFDHWLTTSEPAIVRWAASADVVDYSLQILNSSSQIICEKNGIPGAETSFTLTPADCEPLVNAETYKIIIKSFDIARNTVTAPDYLFTVDRTPPAPFTISGISGGNDVLADEFFGVGAPTVNFTASTGPTRYEVEIKDSSNITVCALSSKAAPTMTFDYAAEGVSCILFDGSIYKAYVSALDDGFNKTPATNNGFTFQVDLQQPLLNITSSPIVLTQSTSASFDFSFSDASSGIKDTLCSIDSGAYTSCASPKSFGGLSQGSHTIQVKAVDKAGNENIKSETWIVDLTNPVLTIHTKPSAISNNPAASFTYSATDTNGIANYTCSLNGSAFAACTSPSNFSVGEGVHSFVIRATDNVSWYDEELVNFLVDLTIPTVNITSTPPAITASKNPSISFTAADTGGSALNRTECSYDAAAFTTCTSPATASNLSDGVHQFRVRSIDNVGNISNIETYSWTVYATGPVMTWDSVPVRDNLTSVSASFHGTVISGVTIAGYQCSVDGGAYSACTSPRTASGLTQGTHTFAVRGIDSLGTTGASISTSWYVDLTGPTTTISSGLTGYQSSNAASFAFSATDAEGSSIAGYECSLDGGAYSACTSPKAYSSLSEGAHTVYVRATDGVGNVGASATRSWTTDYSAPVVTITTAPSSGDTDTTPSISFTRTDAGSGIVSTECRWDSGSWAACTSPVTSGALGLGSHTLTVRATNGAGTVGTDSHTWTINSYSWLTGGYGSCSVSCGGGTQTRAVTCQRNDSATVTDPYCGGGKPGTSQACNTHACEIVVTISSNTNHVNAQSLFSAGDWSSSTPKRVVINSGVTIGSTSTGTAAFRTGGSRGGTLTVQNHGSILGAGGQPNSGNGGTAFLADQSVSLTNTGNIYGGGGAGGVGGNGGPGYYNQAYTAQEGPFYGSNCTGYTFKKAHDNYWEIFWNGSHMGSPGYHADISVYSAGGYTYRRGAYRETVGERPQFNCYEVYREWPSSYVVNTSGGGGGNGGRGRGYDGANASGAGGGAGGTNAGNGGTGGTGGGWGANGASGATGGGGNNGGGSGGGGGGLAGYDIQNPGNVSLSNSGNMLGR